MPINVSTWEISIWSGISAIALLACAELISPRYGRNSILLDSKKIRIAGIVVAGIFVVSVSFVLSSKLVS